MGKVGAASIENICKSGSGTWLVRAYVHFSDFYDSLCKCQFYAPHVSVMSEEQLEAEKAKTAALKTEMEFLKSNRNSFLGIDSGAPYKLKNTGSDRDKNKAYVKESESSLTYCKQAIAASVLKLGQEEQEYAASDHKVLSKENIQGSVQHQRNFFL
jgi:hypothetical protein